MSTIVTSETVMRVNGSDYSFKGVFNEAFNYSLSHQKKGKVGAFCSAFFACIAQSCGFKSKLIESAMGQEARVPNSDIKNRSARDILGVGPNASQQDIQKAYRGKARLYHPDKFEQNRNITGFESKEQATAAFQELKNAYDELKNP